MLKFNNRIYYQWFTYLIQLAIVGIIFFSGWQVYDLLPEKSFNPVWVLVFIFLYFLFLKTSIQNHAGYDVVEFTHYKNGSYSHQSSFLSNKWESKSKEEIDSLISAHSGFPPVVFGFYYSAGITIYCALVFKDFLDNHGWYQMVQLIGGLIGLYYCFLFIGLILNRIVNFINYNLTVGFILKLILFSFVTATVCSTVLFLLEHK